jgi:Fe-Mn family superoxide dismutase
MKMKTLACALGACALAALPAQAQQSADKGGKMQQTMQAYKAAEYPGLAGMPGFSEKLIADHMKLYQGYVNNVNALSEKLSALLADGKEKTPEYAELKRRFGWEFDGMRLHELYFSNMGGAGTPRMSSHVYKAIIESFGSFEAWKKDFAATGSMRGIGWAVLYRDRATGRLFNAWVNEHDGGHLAGCAPLLVMDVFEHAYMPDYRLERAKYIESFFNVIEWEESDRRFHE